MFNRILKSHVIVFHLYSVRVMQVACSSHTNGLLALVHATLTSCVWEGLSDLPLNKEGSSSENCSQLLMYSAECLLQRISFVGTQNKNIINTEASVSTDQK